MPQFEGEYKFSNGTSVEVFDTTIVRIDTDTGLSGYGESCSIGSAYLP